MSELLELAIEMEVFRILMFVLFLLVAFRRLIKRALLRLLRWIDSPETSDDNELAEIIACEKRRMAEESKSENIRPAHKGE